MNIIEVSKEVYEGRATGIKLPGMLGYFIPQGNLRDCTYTWSFLGEDGKVERAWFTPENMLNTDWEVVTVKWGHSKKQVNVTKLTLKLLKKWPINTLIQN